MKKQTSTIVTIIMFVAMFITSIPMQAQFSGGNGTESTPYIITTAAQLEQLAVYVNAGNTTYNNKYYKLGNDIDLSDYGANFNSGKGWKPIGLNASYAFKGNFDGDNHTITNLYINNSADNTGFFGCVQDGTIKNLGVEAISITGSGNMGVVVGSFNNGTIANCHSSGNIIASAGVAGGVVGYMSGSNYNYCNIYSCYATGNVTFSGSTYGFSYIGGIAGHLENCNMNSCYATGYISGVAECIGGVAGWLSDGTITNCYATGNVSGGNTPENYVGGVLGGGYGNRTSASVVNSYALGSVSGISRVGGIVGGAPYYVHDIITIKNCAALNSKVSCYYPQNVGRVLGLNTGALSNNIAFNGLLNYSNNTNWNNVSPISKDGANITKVEIHADGTLGGRFSTAEGWTTENGKLPGLFGNTVNMPEHLRAIPPTITTPTLLPHGIINTAYSQTITATGDTPISWSLTGNLPTGLTLSNEGVISGTPTVLGIFNFNVIATNIWGDDIKTFSIYIFVPPVITTTTLPNGIINTEYTQDLTATGTMPIDWLVLSGNLPTGLTLSTEGIISGTPTVSGSFDFTVQATNIAGSVTRTLTITINIPPVITTTTLPNGIIGTAYNQTLTVTGTSPIAWSFFSGNLPTGLTFDANGTISGIPTEAGIFNFSVQVTNVAGNNIKSLTITILERPVITTTTLPNGIIHTEYSQTLLATGTMPIDWYVFGGNLPTGLTLSKEGIISGIPTVSGIFDFTVQATNIAGSVTRALTITILTPPVITTTTLSNGIANTLYYKTLTATGTTPIDWSLAGGNLPTGLTLSSTGSITGTPITIGKFDFTVQAKNSWGSDTKVLSITILEQIIYFADNFDEYIAGNPLVGQGTPPWRTWTQPTNFEQNPIVTNIQSSTIPNSVLIQNSNDLVFLFENQTNGRYIIEFDYYIPSSGNGAYFNIQNTTDLGIENAWAYQVFFSNDGIGIYYAGSNTEHIFTHPVNTWFHIYNDIDLNANETSLVINGIEAGSWPSIWASLNANGRKQLGAVDFYAMAQSLNSQKSGTYFLDNFKVTTTAPLITTSTLPNGIVNTAYSQTLATMGTTSVAWSLLSGNLPAGLTLSTTGVISGTPTTAGTFNFTVRAGNSEGSSTKALTITIIEPPIITTTTLPDGIMGIYYSETLRATGTAFITWTHFSGNLPTGLTISTDGVISGTPSTAGTFDFSVQAMNDAGSTTQALSITIILPPAITTTILPDGVVNTEYNTTLTATGTAPINWWLINGNLPIGLMLSENGRISGIPTAAGTFNFTVRASNNAGNDTKNLTIIIIEPPAIITTTLPNGTIGISYEQRLIATGTAPIEWSLASGNLPIGLTLSLDGTISGIPYAGGTFNFTVRATNNAGLDTKFLEIVISTPPIITTTDLPNGLLGIWYSQTLTATGTMPIYWMPISGTLPTGLNLSSNDGKISGTPTATGTYLFTVEAINSVGSDTKTLTITIGTTEELPVITTTTLPNGTLGSYYSRKLIATGTEPITWIVETGTLPTGLTLSTTGTISGTPTVANNFNFTVKAANNAGSDTQPLSITIENNATVSISGNIMRENQTLLSSGVVSLYQVQTLSQYTLVDAVPIENDGSYWFSEVQSGGYIIKATAQSEENALPTYYISTEMWQDASLISVVNTSIQNIDITLMGAKGVPPGGNSGINGYVVEENGKSKKSPVEDVNVYLLSFQDNTWSSVSSMSSNAEGYFEFYNLPSGKYITLVDVPGLRMLNTIPLELAATDTINIIFTITDEGIKTELENLGINDVSLPNLNIYPNPTTGELRITNYELGITSVEVFDIYGRNLLSNHLITSSSNHHINISHLATGIYFVKIRTKTGEVVRKVVKE